MNPTRTKPMVTSRIKSILLLLLVGAGSAVVSPARADVDPEARSPAKQKLDRRAAPEDAKSEDVPGESEVVSVAEARRLADAKKFGESARVLRKVLELNPDNDDARSLLARVLAWDRKYDESIAVYQKILRKHPDNAFEQAGYARVLAWSGRAEESLDQFRRAADKDTTNVETRVGYARALSWAGDLPGASMEYESILDQKPAYGDAWLGIATVARWRGAPTASGRFVALAETQGADKEAIEEEKRAIRVANASSVGAGWMTANERQYVAAQDDYSIESTGPYVTARATVGSTGVSGRYSQIAQFEVSQGPSTAATTLNYDVDMSVVRADVSYLRNYPFQLTAGLEGRWLDEASPNVIYPLSGKDAFFGWTTRAWWFLGRWTPGVSLYRSFIPIKTTTGPQELEAGYQTVLAGDLGYQWNARWSATAGLEAASYSDDNQRGTVRAGAAYRIRLNRPSITGDYALSIADFDFSSASYFTPLESVRNTLGVSASGYSENAGLDYGARYQISMISSSNFDNIATHTVSGYLGATLFGEVPVGIDASYGRDNNDYETWSLGISASGRW